MEQIKLDRASILAIAQQVVSLLDARQRQEKKQKRCMLTTTQAANVLGITPARLRQVKDRYPHCKGSSAQQGRLYFDLSDYLNYHPIHTHENYT